MYGIWLFLKGFTCVFLWVHWETSHRDDAFPLFIFPYLKCDAMPCNAMQAIVPVNDGVVMLRQLRVWRWPGRSG